MDHRFLAFQMHESPRRSAGLGMKSSQACVPQGISVSHRRIANGLFRRSSNQWTHNPDFAVPDKALGRIGSRVAFDGHDVRNADMWRKLVRPHA
ncbi:MAG: hypothetical protein OXH76_03125 [Boseongicola sp.]|nr:hypothetical protein [Boseongicola sp.]